MPSSVRRAIVRTVLVAAPLPLRSAFARGPLAPITVVVPFAAGGPTDTIARALVPALERALGEPVRIDNVAGAGGTRGTLAVARAEPDGRTLLLHHIGLATAPALYRRLPYDPQRDLRPVGRVADVPMTLVVRRDFPARTPFEAARRLRDTAAGALVAYAGLGAASHLCGLLLAEALATDLIQIPYPGTGPALRDLVAGRVDLMCDQTTNTLPAILAGEIRAIAVTGDRPLSGLPQVPTTAAVGLDGVRVSAWHGLYVTATPPADVLQRLVAALAVARADPAFVDAVERSHGVVPAPEAAGAAALATLLATETRRWGVVIRRSGQQAD